MPNPYDRGLLQNFGEVFFPRSVRPDTVPAPGTPTEIKRIPLAVPQRRAEEPESDLEPMAGGGEQAGGGGGGGGSKQEKAE